MNKRKTFILISKIWLVIFSLIFLHSLFPPRIELPKAESVGRSFIVLDSFYKTDILIMGKTAEENEDKLEAYKSRQYHSWDGVRSTAWNSAVMDWSRYVVGILILLSFGMMSSVYIILRSMRDNKSEQNGVERPLPAP